MVIGLDSYLYVSVWSISRLLQQLSSIFVIYILTAKNSIFGYDFVHQPKRPKSNANVRAASSVEIHYIHKDDMNQILRMYPKFAKSFRETLNIGFDLNDEGEVGGMIIM